MRGERNQILLLLGAILMAIDHVGAILFPFEIGFRLVGRLSFPLFAFGIAEGVTHTRNFPRYFLRIFVTAMVSQPIYMLAFGARTGNPLFTLAYGAMTLNLWRREKHFLACLLLVLSYFFSFSYGWYGVATIFFYGFYFQQKNLSLYGNVALQGLYALQYRNWLQAYSILAFPLIGAKWKWNISLPRYFFYLFYPTHLLILVGIKGLLF